MAPGTFSIVARDPETGDLGVATQSKFIAVGAVVPWARADVGAVATQAQANVTFGPEGLRRMQGGDTPEEVIARLMEEDPQASVRQVGVVDARGRSAAFTGERCLEWAGHVVGKAFCALGNILASEMVVNAMAAAYEGTEEPLPERLLAALVAGQGAGGDRRGQQSASLLVVREGGSYGGFTDRYIDLRVDDHPAPITELQRVFQVYDLTLLEREDPEDVVRLVGSPAEDVQARLAKAGFFHGAVDGRWSGESREALERFFHEHNFENKWRDDGTLWGSVYRYMQRELPRD
ncbi:MAG: DUF1028 domain-containing protein [Thermoplasmata archaeon]|nr:DUF1028 domain-containing protein [Thermoplasmata archaeon]